MILVVDVVVKGESVEIELAFADCSERVALNDILSVPKVPNVETDGEAWLGGEFVVDVRVQLIEVAVIPLQNLNEVGLFEVLVVPLRNVLFKGFAVRAS